MLLFFAQGNTKSLFSFVGLSSMYFSSDFLQIYVVFGFCQVIPTCTCSQSNPFEEDNFLSDNFWQGWKARSVCVEFSWYQEVNCAKK